MDVQVASGACLCLLPDPVSCFRLAKYNQTQIIHLENDASLVLLDSFTSGRMSRGEEWAFLRYFSLNEIWVNGNRIARDALLLEQDQSKNEASASENTESTLFQRLRPYGCYATVFLYGPLLKELIQDIFADYDKIVVFKSRNLNDLMWSLSPLDNRNGCVIRVAAKETENVSHWLRDTLVKLVDVIGLDVYRRAFPS